MVSLRISSNDASHFTQGSYACSEVSHAIIASYHRQLQNCLHGSMPNIVDHTRSDV